MLPPQQLLLPNVLDSNSGVVSHGIVSAVKQGALSKFSIQTLAWMFTQVNKDNDSLEYHIRREDFKKFLNLPQKNLNREIDKICSQLTGHVIKINSESKIIYDNLASAVYDKRTNITTFKFNEEFKDYILDTKRHFSKFRLGDALCMENSYHFYMYLLIKKFLHEGTYEFVTDIAVEDLKVYLGCRADLNKQSSKDKYPLYANFKTRVLVPTKDFFDNTPEIDISFEFVELKESRKVTHLEFTFYRKSRNRKKMSKNNDATPDLIVDSEELQQKALEYIRENRQKCYEASPFIDTHGIDEVSDSILISTALLLISQEN